MNRRGIFKVLATVAAAVSFTGRGAAAASEKPHRLALHVDQNDAEVMKLAFNNARNASKLYKERGEDIAVEIVTYSQGLHMLRDDTSPVKREIAELRKEIPNLVLSGCNNTKVGMEKREGKSVPIIAEARIVPAGIVRLMELQEEGYAYVKP